MTVTELKKNDLAKELTRGLEVDEARDYLRLRTNGRTVGWISPRFNGEVIRLDHMPKRIIEAAPAKLRQSIDANGCMKVTAKNLKKARALIDHIHTARVRQLQA